jgi:peptidyl-tRNA hydrolase, PTH1 family
VRLIVGLGNPGKQYALTPHNVGFDVVDKLSDDLAGAWRRSWRFHAHVSEVKLGAADLLLAKPQTFMNNSGSAVGALLRYRKAAVAEMIAALDDADLEMGRIRIRARGSSGGHRGLESIIQAVGSPDFARVRIGIGRGRAGANLVEHVLQPFSDEERRQMGRVIEAASQAVRTIVELGVEEAMNRFNGLPSLIGQG